MNKHARYSTARLLTLSALLLALGCSRTQSRPEVPPGLAAAGKHSIADVAEQSLPSVVNIASSKLIQRQESPFFNDPFFRFFFKHPFFRHRRAPRERRQRSLGSGVIVGAGGIVITNNHVVDKSHEIRVTTAGGIELEAEIVGRDEDSDLAVLRLKGDTSELRPLPFGDSDTLRLGDVVIAIGNPFGVGQTVTMGIVSAKGRTNMGIVPHEDFIQTDAAINPGNSGGALINMRGELIGINTAIVSRSGGYQGVGFAIPSNLARRVRDSIVEHGKVLRGWLGIAFQDLTPELAAAMGITGRRGALVSDVVEDSPAANSGLQRGDVVLQLNGRAVQDASHLRTLIASAGAGTTVSLRVARGGASRTIEVQLTEDPTRAGGQTQLGADEGALGGVALANLDDETRREHSVPDRIQSGVVVESIARTSRAAASGLRPGDILLEINRQPIQSAQQFVQLYRRATSRVLLLVWRQGSTLFLLLGK
jgi:serine protease Do